jgi:hypothetical protein
METVKNFMECDTFQSCRNLSHFGTFQKVLLTMFYFLNLTFASLCIIVRFKQINQLDAIVSQVYYLTFMCGSTCFGHFHSHLETC